MHEGIRIDCQVDPDGDWFTRLARIEMPALATGFDIRVDSPGKWVIDGKPRRELDACIDIDLGWTARRRTPSPSTPRPWLGTRKTIKVGWLRSFELLLVPNKQTCTKGADGLWEEAPHIRTPESFT